MICLVLFVSGSILFKNFKPSLPKFKSKYATAALQYKIAKRRGKKIKNRLTFAI